MKRISGFTLVELVVVVGVLGMMMVALTGILLNTFKVKNRLTNSESVEQNGSFILSELRKNIINSQSSEIDCFEDGLVINGVGVSLVCIEGDRIASVSADGEYRLSGSNVKVSGCSNFVGCYMDLPKPQVEFKFNLQVGDSSPGAGVENYVLRMFKSRVTLRN